MANQSFTLLQEGKFKKKILFISTLTPPFGGSAMSSEMCLKILNEDKRFYVKNIKLNYSLDMSDVGKINFKKILGLFVVRKEIRKLVKCFKPDVIYFVPAVAGFALLRDFYFLRIIKKLKTGKLILHIRVQFKKNWNNPLKKAIIRDLLDCNKAIVLGSELIEDLKKRGLNKKISILPNAIPNSISNSDFTEIINKRTGNKNLNLLFLSHMHETKGWFKVLEACKLLIDSGIEIICHFVGGWISKRDSKRFFNFIEENNLKSKIFYHGILLNKEKSNILAASDILVFPTEYEAFGRVIIEAMEFGLPVIANNVGSIPSIIKHGETGYILKNNTPSEIFECINKLLNENLRKEMGLKARHHFLENFSLDTYKNRFIKIINED